MLTEGLIGGAGALVILFFVFGTLPAVLMPIAVAVAAILNTFTLVWALTYLTNVSIIVEFLIALVGLGVAIDYALLMIFRFRDELRDGSDVESALVETMTHAGRSVIVSGSTVAVGLLSMIVLPLPFIRSIGIGGMLIPAVSVLAAITLLPALLATLGTRINSVRLLPRRFVDSGHPEDGLLGPLGRARDAPPGRRSAALRAGRRRRCSPTRGSQLNPAEAQVKDIPGSGAAIVGRTVLDARRHLRPGVMKPFEVLVARGGSDARAMRRASCAATPGITAAAAPRGLAQGPGYSLVEAFPSDRRRLAPRSRATIRDGARTSSAGDDDARARRRPRRGPRLRRTPSTRTSPTCSASSCCLTFVLLARAFRSLVLPLKAVILNLLSLAAAYGIIVFIFQEGHGSMAIWGVAATQSIIPWIPLMIFAFLFGLSMDYEVFMLTRMREAYDETRRHPPRDLARARPHRQARDERGADPHVRVLRALLEPRPRHQAVRIGLAAGIIFDATVIRALLVPAIMRLLGRWNWWMPAPVARVLALAPRRGRRA